MYAGRLRKLRKDANKTQQEMAKFLGITRQGYGNYENNNTEPDNETLNKLADYFDTTIDYLTGRTDERRQNKKESAGAPPSILDEAVRRIENELGVSLADDPDIIAGVESYLVTMGKLKKKSD